MKSFNQYFKAHFLNTWIRIPFFTVLSVIVLTVQTSGAMESIEQVGYYKRSNIDVFTMFILVLSLAIPVCEFYQLNDKRNMDTLLALPIGKCNLLAVHFLNGLFQIVISLSIMYLWWLLTFALNSSVVLNSKYFFSLFLAIVGMGISFYCLFSFAFIQGNNIIDGIIFMAIWSVMLSVLGNLYQHVANNLAGGGYLYMNAWYYRIGYWSYLLSPYWYAATTMDYFDKALEPRSYYVDEEYVWVFNDFPSTVHHPVATGCYCAIAVVSVILLFVTFRKKKFYKLGDCSDSLFGYRITVPLLALYPFMSYSRGGEWTIFELILISIPGLSYYYTPLVLFGGYAVMRRGIRFTVTDIVIMAMSIAPFLYIILKWIFS